MPRGHVPDAAEAQRRLGQMGPQHGVRAPSQAHVSAAHDARGQPPEPTTFLLGRAGFCLHSAGLTDNAKLRKAALKIGKLTIDKNGITNIVSRVRPLRGELLNRERRKLRKRWDPPKMVMRIYDRQCRI